MDLSTLDLLSLQSKTMQNDSTTQGICAAINPQLNIISLQTNLILIYSRIDELSSEVLDILAWQFHIDFYDSSASIDVKREAVKTGLILHKTKGTPYAVERIINIFYKGNATLKEWWEYGADPYHFKIIVSGNVQNLRDLDNIYKAIDSVKNTRSWLDSIEFIDVDNSWDALDARDISFDELDALDISFNIFDIGGW